MTNSEYKCLCCGSIGSEEEFGIVSKGESTGTNELLVCPLCGSMEIDILIAEENLSV